ncbi:hypothetical protein [Delftia tsuruhatensis]|uniref:hypothetical protein n=1 Tax=Delftia tsuruhatensis TaxID=180282 RepID=UPI002029181F|nr:hypothetical protein [Delftia tsuruhatensis]
MNIDNVVKIFAEESGAIAIGPSALESLAYEELCPNDDKKIALPGNLMRLLYLIRQGSYEHRIFLIRIIRYFRSSRRKAVDHEYQDHEVVGRIVMMVEKFERDNRLIIIDDEMTDPVIKESLSNLYPGPAFEISLSPKRNFLRDYLVRIYTWSKHTGGLILERTRRVFSDIGHHIATFQLPDKLDGYIQFKSRYVGRMFGFRGGKATKFFVGCAIGIAGLGSPAASIAGVVIAFADP